MMTTMVDGGERHVDDRESEYEKGREKISKQLALCVTITTLCEFINLNVISQEKQRVESSVQFQHVLARQRYFIFSRKSHLSCRRW